MATMQLIDTLDERHIPQLHALYRNVWWGHARTLEETRRCLQGSQLTLGIVDAQGDLIAFTRVLTDFVFKALIFDVIVSPAHQGLGLGDRLIEAVKHHERLAGIGHLELYCREDMNDFYVRHGFTRSLGDLQLMRHTRSPSP